MLQLTHDDPPTCATKDDGSACQFFWELTGQSWLASSSDALIITPLRILLIVVVTLIVRSIIHRAVRRLVRSTVNGASPKLLRPFKERMPGRLNGLLVDEEQAALLGDRRRQRAETLGSVLNKGVSGVLFTITFILILTEVNINIGPIIASAGIVGLAIGFGAQTLVKDMISGLFMLLEDEYGIGDFVDLGEASGTVEAVGLRTTTLRDLQGTLWHVRNGEILRVGNHSQSWANVVVDVPLAPTVDVDAAGEAVLAAARAVYEDPEWSDQLLEEPVLMGVQDMNVDAVVMRIAIKSDSDSQWAVGRELRRRIGERLRAQGFSDALSGSRVYVPRSQSGPSQ